MKGIGKGLRAMGLKTFREAVDEDYGSKIGEGRQRGTVLGVQEELGKQNGFKEEGCTTVMVIHGLADVGIQWWGGSFMDETAKAMERGRVFRGGERIWLAKERNGSVSLRGIGARSRGRGTWRFGK
ncbi:unnamed protein product [Calypogeia fissa]